MKMGSFLVGGLVGIAATVYFTNRKSSFMTAFMGSQDTSSHQSDKRHSGSSFQSGTDGKSSSASTFRKDSGVDGLNKVADIINEDPKLKEQVDEIFAENKNKGNHTVQGSKSDDSAVIQ